MTSSELWNAWKSSPRIRELAEAYLTAPAGMWTEERELLCNLLHSDPDQALAVILAAIQMVTDPIQIGDVAAGPLEEFLRVNGEDYLPVIEELAKQHTELRIALNGVWQGAMPKHVWHRIEIWKQKSA
jgi:hypothetical protein